MQLIGILRWGFCLSCLSVVVFFLSSLLPRVSFFFSLWLTLPCQPPSIKLLVRLALRGMFISVVLFSSLSVSRLPLASVFGLALVFSSFSLAVKLLVRPLLSLSLSSVCDGAPCKSPNFDSYLL